MTEIPEAHVDLVCKKSPVCKFMGTKETKKICLKNSPFAPAIIQLEGIYAKEALENDKDYPSGDNCDGMDPVKD